jgi:SAM-dependent methyltransferase
VGEIPARAAEHPDRLRWNAKYARRTVGGPHPLAVRALSLALPEGPVLDLACGPSGSALLAAESGRAVTAVDISDVALDLLAGEARRRGLDERVTVVRADLAGRDADPAAWAPKGRGYALVLCTGFWDRAVFAAAVGVVAAGGLLAWEAFTTEARRVRPGLPSAWCLRPGEPASLLPDGFTVLDAESPAASPPPAGSPGPDTPGVKRRLLARAAT